MEYRQLGNSGLRVPALSFGAGTFGGQGPLFGAWGTIDAREANRMIDISLEAGLNMFDSADVYSDGASEQVLGESHQRTPRQNHTVDQTGLAGWRWPE